MNEDTIDLLNRTALMLRGMTMDPAIPTLVKGVMWDRIATIEAFVERALEGGDTAELARPEPCRLAEDAAMLRFLIDACGHWQDGSSTVVKLFDDDATRQYLVKIGNRRYAGGGSMRAAIKAAMAADA